MRDSSQNLTVATTGARIHYRAAHLLRRTPRKMSLDTAILHAALTATGKSQADIARAMGVSKATVSRWFSGRGEPETVERLRQLAAELELSLAAMVGEDAAANERERLLLQAFRGQDPTQADAILALLVANTKRHSG